MHHTQLIRHQDAVHAEGGGQSTKQHPRYELPDHTMTPYAWDFPAARDKKIQLRIYDARRSVDISEVSITQSWPRDDFETFPDWTAHALRLHGKSTSTSLSKQY